MKPLALVLFCSALASVGCANDPASAPPDAHLDANHDAGLDANRDGASERFDGRRDLGGGHDGEVDVRGNEGGVCGANKAFHVETCTSQCPAPCRCVALVWDPSPLPGFPALCAKPCANAWDCSGDERCGYKGTPEQDAGEPVCLPPTVYTPPAVGGGGGSIDCIFYPQLGALHCEGGHILQEQPIGLAGAFSGCFVAKVRVEDCAAGCEATDAGGVRCSTAWPDAGPSDAGPSDAGPSDAGPSDAGPSDAGVSCCPGQKTPQAFGCFGLGGEKKPPRGCAIACCRLYRDAGCPSYATVATPEGCTELVAQPRDAGPRD